MREIKFRGKSIYTGEWLYGDILIHGETAQIWVNTDDGKWNYIVDPETIGQFTGLHDKNSVEIYEGDICEFKLFNCRRVGVVLFSEEKYRYELLQSGDIDWSLEIHEAFDLEVIGNIHDQEVHCETNL